MIAARRLFDKCDVNGNGYLNYREFTDMCQSSVADSDSISVTTMTNAFRTMDSQGMCGDRETETDVWGQRDRERCVFVYTSVQKAQERERDSFVQKCNHICHLFFCSSFIYNYIPISSLTLSHSLSYPPSILLLLKTWVIFRSPLL